MQNIIPCLWFNDQAEEAVNFYTSLFGNSQVGKAARYDKASAEVSGRPEGSVLTVDFELEGQKFLALNGGPLFKLTPAISFSVGCTTEEEIDRLYAALSEGGFVMMPFQEYPFSKKYAWVADRYGVSWQLNLAPSPQKIRPSFLFVGEQYGKCEEAMKFYTSLFPNSSVGQIARYEAGEGDKEGMIKHAEFSLDSHQFIAMESGYDHKFTFTEAMSLMVMCETQEEIDRFWSSLSAVKESEQCGWLKDKYGVSWQIVPTVLEKLLSDPDPAKAQRAMKAMLQMKKLDIRGLEGA